ncbi:hypothetical protein Ahy_A09g045834 isoform A [Arachis hypogaea]|uniref:Transposase MuDR plant domain-containing protein n=1 Tax=Arachis hypogaea TaxID=3818 RepID=A0A445BNB6_ARAHY|nr:hypothetical protein Ahy_A09g045834 isoform A [Arachis hypogaea]
MRQPQIELYVEFETVEAEGIQNDLDIEDDRYTDFKATYEVGDEDEDGDVGVEIAAENVVVHPSSSQPINVPPFMRELDLDAMHAPEFLEYANIGVADLEDRKFHIGMEYNSRKSVVAAIRSYTISRGVDYDVYESESQTFYAKCKMYGGLSFSPKPPSSFFPQNPLLFSNKNAPPPFSVILTLLTPSNAYTGRGVSLFIEQDLQLTGVEELSPACRQLPTCPLCVAAKHWKFAELYHACSNTPPACCWDADTLLQHSGTTLSAC